MMVWILGLFVSLFLETAATAEEARCNELGANCVCSEPLQATGYTQLQTYWFNPNDSITKECNDGVPGAAWSRGGGATDIFFDNDATALAAFPAGRTVQRFLRGPSGHIGSWDVGNSTWPNNGTAFLKRRSSRWYVYHSPDYEFADTPTCQNSKLAQFDRGNSTNPTAVFLLDNSHKGKVSLYNFLAAYPAQDCCGPDGLSWRSIDESFWRGKWVRVEIIQHNVDGAGGGWWLDTMLYNVTDNIAEFNASDMLSATIRGQASNLSPPGTRTFDAGVVFSFFASNNYRQSSVGSCTGWRAVSHFMSAGWDTDAGQRIGAAAEVEGALGGGGGVTGGMGGAIKAVGGVRLF